MTTLLVETPQGYGPERQYILNILLQEFLGLQWQLRQSDRYDVRITCLGTPGEVLLPDVLFQTRQSEWLTAESMPRWPLPIWDTRDSDLEVNLIQSVVPVIYGDAEPKTIRELDSIRLPLDIFGSAFFMLTRYEELVVTERDEHERFPASASVAHAAGFLGRPVVDEYVELLWVCGKHLWPQLDRRVREGEVFVTCDVDHPFDCAVRSAKLFLRRLGGDVLRRKDIKSAACRMRNYLATRRGDYSYDPNYTFEWYMNTCERNGRRAAFFFIPDNTAGAIDGCYDLAEPRIESLIRTISERGHEVGVHGSYNTYLSAAQIRKERGRMIATCTRVSADPSVAGNRQHYLRWDTRETPDHLDTAGYEYDTTGCFADLPGFRYGTAQSFSMWSWLKEAPLRIKQRPLILMECSVIANRYLGLSYTEAAMAVMQDLKQKALRYDGDFTMLWHNSQLANPVEREFFAYLLK